MSNKSALKVYKNEEKTLIIKSLKAMVDNINLISFEERIPGLCRLNDHLYNIGILNDFEYDALVQYLDTNLPKRRYCWKTFTIPYRLKWLNKQIQILEKQSI